MHLSKVWTCIFFVSMLLLGIVYCNANVVLRTDNNPFAVVKTAPDGGKAPNPFRGQGQPLDFSAMTPKQILDFYGLANAIPLLTEMLDHADEMFKFATREKHFEMVNRILGGLKDSFLGTVRLVQKAPVPLPHTIDKDMIDQVAEVWEQQFHDILAKDPDVDLNLIEPFFRNYADQFFLAMRNGYKHLFEMGISLTWPIVYMFTPYIERLDVALLRRDMFADVLDAPEHLKKFLYDTLAEVMTSDYAHIIQMAATLLSNIDLKKLMGQKVEL